MRRNSRLTFTKRSDRPTLTLEEARYWKRILESVSKMGYEHEFNLKENMGKCDGKSLMCPCNHQEKETRKCYEKCKIYNSCSLRDKYECPGIYCIEFVEPCPTCPEATKDCSRCDLYNNPNVNPEACRTNIIKDLKPTKDLSKVGDNGTFEVVTDGSLLGNGGAEITTVGRRVSFDSFYIQAKEIMDKCIKNGAYVNERCSMHLHLVAGYFTMTVKDGEISIYYKKGHNTESNFSELEKPMPEIILANFHQLIRRYHNALTWMTSAGDNYNHLTRWIKFRKPILQFSAVRQPMRKIISELSRKDDHGGRYFIMNYSPIRFTSTGEMKVFHVESRFCDGILSPSAAAAFGVLFYALLLKSVVLSQFGIVHSGDSEYMEEARVIQNALLNNSGSWSGPRHSDTRNFEPYREKVRQQAKEMLDILRPELVKHGPTLNILKSLADMPCSMRLCSAHTWEKIEEDLSGNTNHSGESTNSVLSLVDMSYVDDCINIDEWVKTIAEDLKTNEAEMKETVETLLNKNIVCWDGVAGTLVRC